MGVYCTITVANTFLRYMSVNLVSLNANYHSVHPHSIQGSEDYVYITYSIGFIDYMQPTVQHTHTPCTPPPHPMYTPLAPTPTHKHMMVKQYSGLSIYQMTNQHYIMYSVICLDPISCYRVYSLSKVHAVLYIVCICPFHVCIHAMYSVHSSELTSETHYLCIASHVCLSVVATHHLS